MRIQIYSKYETIFVKIHSKERIYEQREIWYTWQVNNFACQNDLDYFHYIMIEGLSMLTCSPFVTMAEIYTPINSLLIIFVTWQIVFMLNPWWPFYLRTTLIMFLRSQEFFDERGHKKFSMNQFFLPVLSMLLTIPIYNLKKSANGNRSPKNIRYIKYSLYKYGLN